MLDTCWHKRQSWHFFNYKVINTKQEKCNLRKQQDIFYKPVSDIQ